MTDSGYMRKIRKHYANVVATLALVVALTIGGAYASNALITSKQIRNGSVKSVDLKNGGVAGVDVKNDTINSPDLAEGAVEGEALELPQPTQCDVAGDVKINPTMQFAKVADVCTYTKVSPDSALEINWTGTVEGHNGGNFSGCVFQLRVNDAASSQGGGEVFARGVSPVSDAALFPGIATGAVTVSIWARLAVQEPGMGGDFDSCTIGPASAGGVKQTIVIVEQVV